MQRQPYFSPTSNRAIERFQANERRREALAPRSNRKHFIRVNGDGSTGQPISASSPARAAAKAFRGGGDTGTFLIVEINPESRQRGAGVHKYSVQFRALNQSEIERDSFLRDGTSSIRQRKNAQRHRITEQELRAGLVARDRITGAQEPPTPTAREEARPPSRRNVRGGARANAEVRNPFPSVGVSP